MSVTVSTIETMDRAGLLCLWAEEFGGVAPKHQSIPLLRRILAFEIQARRHGGIGAQLRKRLARADHEKARRSAPKLRPGARLIREWNGVSHVVDVLEDGYRWRGERYRSLSAIARAITGAHWSGSRFFGLREGAKR
ncbi:MAG: DUF2924 domain-containing protein [Pseudomonadota bacterium]